LRKQFLFACKRGRQALSSGRPSRGLAGQREHRRARGGWGRGL